VEDLQFRLLAVDGNIAILLQLLTSMQEAAPSDLDGEATTANPESATDDGKTLEPSLPSKEPHGIQHAEEAKEMDTGQEGCAGYSASCQDRRRRGRGEALG
jgi:hypothetical protein